MRTKKAKKDAKAQKQRDGSRVGGFVVGALIGVLLGWVGGQFMRFDTGWDLLAYLGAFGAFFGTLGAVLPEKSFLSLLNWFR